eukprot:8833852-Pyramimonas_sp.AAC.1
MMITDAVGNGRALMPSGSGSDGLQVAGMTRMITTVAILRGEKNTASSGPAAPALLAGEERDRAPVRGLLLPRFAPGNIFRGGRRSASALPKGGPAGSSAPLRLALC